MLGGEVSISGHQCERGVEYGEMEALNPKRTVTSSVLVIDGEMPLVSVRTSVAVPKDRIMEVMYEVRSASMEAPVSIGDVIIPNVAGTGVDVVATRTVPRRLH
jgi:CxxC motif-containing protein